MTILIGADPELFVRDEKNNLVSAHGLIPGTKQKPCAVEGGAIQVDGMAVEFNIDPASTEDEFVERIFGVRRQLEDHLPSGYTTVAIPTAMFGAKYIEAQPREAKILGCDPDFNAYKQGRVNPTPDIKTPFRTAAGHIHIGWGEDYSPDDPTHNLFCCNLVSNLDLSLGLCSLRYDPDARRRSLYGQAGAYRPKSYGLEYRVLSNFWLTSTERVKWVYKVTRRQTEMQIADVKKRGLRWRIGGLRHQRAINGMYHGRGVMINNALNGYGVRSMN